MPIPKVKPPSSIENDFRPIALTPTVSKVFEALVGRRMLDSVAEKIDKRQYGARRGRSTVHALVDMLHTWHSALDRGDAVRTVFVDYAKAFDHVCHNVILNKMLIIGIEPWIVKWFHSFLIDRLYRVKIGKCCSHFVKFNGGLPQGTWSGPFAFLILINDLELSVLAHKFVDDVILTEIIPPGDRSLMQAACSQLEVWSRSNCMNINLRKTHEMLIGRKAVDFEPLHIDDTDISRVESFKLLGIVVQSSLKWSEHVQYMCYKASKSLYLLKRLRRAMLSEDDLVYFYCTVVRPILEYACCVWHSSLTRQQSDCIEQIQKRALGIIFGFSLSYSDKLAIAQLELLSDRREELCRRLFTDIVSDSEHCLHQLLPRKRSATSVVTRSQDTVTFALPRYRTSRFKKSFVMYCLDSFI